MHSRSNAVVPSAVSLLTLLVVGLSTAINQAATPAAVTLAVQGRSNANVSLAASGPFVAAVWSGSLPAGSTDIFAAMSRDSGATFSAPVRVNTKAGDARVNGEQPPRIAMIPRAGGAPVLVVVWTSKGDVGTTILSARSDDGARTFSQSTAVPGGEAQGNRGWESITVDRHGSVRIVWLDHREMANPTSEHDHAGHDSSAAAKRDGAAMAQQSKLYVATIGNPGTARSLLGGVCYCCKTAIATGPNNDIYLAWRHVYAGNIRDITFAASRDDAKTFAAPIRVSDDKWQLDGCPEDGPSLAVDTGNQIHVVWPTLVSEGPAGTSSIGLFYARSSDGRVFSARVRIPTEGLPHHPQIQLAGETLVVAWDELKNGVRRAIVARGSIANNPGADFARQVVSGDAPGIYPALAVSGRRAIVAWTASGANSAIRVAALQ